MWKTRRKEIKLKQLTSTINKNHNKFINQLNINIKSNLILNFNTREILQLVILKLSLEINHKRKNQNNLLALKIGIQTLIPLQVLNNMSNTRKTEMTRLRTNISTKYTMRKIWKK